MRNLPLETPSKDIYALFVENSSSNDGAKVRDCIKQLVANPPHFLQIENSIDAAINAIGQCIYDVIFIHLPNLEDQESVVAELKRVRTASGETPMLAMANNVTAEFEKLVTESGAYDCLPVETLTVDFVRRSLRFAISTKRAETYLREIYARASESERKLQLTLTLARTGVWTWHIKDDTHDWDAEMIRMFGGQNGYTTELFLQFIHEEDRPRVIDAINHSRYDGVDYMAEYRVIWPDGSLHWIVATGQTVADEKGVPTRMTGVCREITRFKEQDETKRKLALLEQRQEFTTMLAHDLKAPVMSAQRIIEHVLDGKMGELPPDAATVMGQVHRSNDSLLALINNVMDAYRLESNQQYFVVAELEVNELFSHSTSQMKHLATSKGLELEFSCPPKLQILGDKVSMDRVLCNLVSNAIKFTEKGGRIKLAASIERDTALLTVTDTGIGITESDIVNIFDRFYQAHAQSRTCGLGLGLYLCRSLVRGQRGDITCTSTVGGGSTFTVCMPLAEAGSDIKILAGERSSAI